MKFDYFLIAFIFVIILEDVELYKFQVYITNLYIKQAKEQGIFYAVVQRYIQSLNTSMELSLIFAVPDKANYRRHPQLCVDREIRVGNLIYAVLGDFNLLRNTNLSIEQILELVHDVSNVFPNADEEQTEYSLSELGFARRQETRNTIRSSIITFSGPTETVSIFMCRRIGLIRSILHPDSFITNAVMEENDTCVLTTTTDPDSVWKYRYVGGEICQVDINDVTRSIEPLANQMVW
ncbi:uncharacterized protein LOC126834096 isoform X5 [Adelges cooleyi]|uniref:uncharacterized protein LOC126834096 isoform X5 n=1 Tax=Adelges cooleyi TaxID=133065 RepID=UPI0021801B6C|nr:uncharacterized protein LOC126834096 isoform X5 [Adelges cooleyi]